MTLSPRTIPSRLRPWLVLLVLAAAAVLCEPSRAQVPDRIAPSFSANNQARLKGSLHPFANPANDHGRASAITKVPNMMLVFSPSAAQKADLATLMAAQQNPASASYHQWLTPAQYGARFGMSAQDLSTTEAWLEAKGFTILGVGSARNEIQFRGTVAQVETAFSTEMHQYLVNGSLHLANSTELTMPAALAGATAGIHGLAQFRPHPMHTAARRVSADAVKPAYTTSTTPPAHYLAPSDVTTIYDIKALYSAGYTGSGATIAVVGESAVNTSDISAFRTDFGLPTNNPTLTLVPNTGTAVTSSDPEGEADLDLEWSGAVAPNASIIYLYSGATGDVLDALTYAINQKTAPVVTISYGECEPGAGSDPGTFEPLFMEANTQGQTILASSGDQGATACDTGLNSSGNAAASATQGLAVSYPASSSFVTAMGGTQFNEGSTNYWNSTNDSGGGSAISYIPEIAWNETATSQDQTNAQGAATPGGFASTGGGPSMLFGKPSWQVALNVPDDGARDVPDISLDAAVYTDGFLYCSNGDCSDSFDVAGGTSFDAPIFAGILTLINQKNATTGGAGNINPTLYTLYGTTASAFHDITSGNNEQPCQAGSTDCPAGTTEIGYTAGVGYDLTTGLGSIDAFLLAEAFPTGSGTTTNPLLLSTTTVSPSTYGPGVGTSVTLTATVASAASNAAPSGTVQFTVNGANVGSPVTLTPVANSLTATAAYTTSFSATGTDTVTAIYSGNTTIASSTSNTVTLTVGTNTAPSPDFTLAATNVTVVSGSSAATTLTLTSQNGYVGTVDYGYTTSTGFTGCLFGSSTEGASSDTAVTESITVDTLPSDCVSTGARHMLAKGGTVRTSQSGPAPWQPGREYPIAAAALLAGLALAGRKRKGWPAAMLLMLVSLGTMTALSGCGGSSTSSSSGTALGVPRGTYTITLTGTDSSNTNLTATTTFTVTVQ